MGIFGKELFPPFGVLFGDGLGLDLAFLGVPPNFSSPLVGIYHIFNGLESSRKSNCWVYFAFIR